MPCHRKKPGTINDPYCNKIILTFAELLGASIMLVKAELKQTECFINSNHKKNKNTY
jgi:hypothetical protein